MSSVLWSNDATTTLAGSISSGATSLTVTSGSGSLFPSPTSGQIFALVLISAVNTATREVLYCTARSGDVMTVERAQEGTTALSWNAGDLAQNLVTAGTLESLGLAYTTDTGTANAIAINVPTNPTSIAAMAGQAFFVVKGSAANTGAVTINPNGIGATTTVRADGTALTSGQWPAGAIGLVVCNGTQFYILTITGPSLLAPLASPAFTGIPTAPTAAPGTSTTQIATTAFVNPGSSLGSTWYRMLPDSSIEQGGFVSAQGGATTETYSFNVTFPSVCFDLQITYGSSLGANTYALGGGVPNTSQFTVTNTDSGTHGFYWLAKGY